MQFRVLGPLELSCTTDNLTPTAPKVREVLALLIMRNNRLVQVADLIDELWGERPPVSALTTLQTYIYKLRKIFAEAGLDPETLLCTRPLGYLLAVPAADVDLFQFENLVEEGRQVVDGEPERAAEILSRALALWRGPALADVITGELLAAQVTRLEERRIYALGLRLDAELRLGRHGALISELRTLAASHPLHEGFHAKLMLALYRSGRRGEALETYRGLRNVLIDELGVEPSPSIQRMQQDILASDASLDGARGPAVVAGAKRLPPPAQLPADIPDLVGHGDVVDRAEKLITAAPRSGTAIRVLVLTGMPGIGKTVTAVHLAHRVCAQFPDGQFFAELGGISGEPVGPDAVLDRFLRAAGVAHVPPGIGERMALFRSWCSGREALLVLDDATSVRQVLPLLPGSAKCAVIITSRFGLQGIANAHVIELAPLTLGEGVRLLASVIGTQRIDEERMAAEEIVRLCGQLPLALRSVGSRIATIRGWSLGTFAGHLAATCRCLDEMDAADMSLRARFDSSYGRLTDREQRILRLASLLPGPYFASRHVSGLLGCATEAAEGALLRLVEHHFIIVVRESATPEPRYAFHEFTRAYVRERLAAELAHHDPLEAI